jgi:hypothetical protein
LHIAVNVLSHLLGQRSAERVIPDLVALRANPAAFLRQRDVEIDGVRTVPVGTIVLLFSGFLVWWWWDARWLSVERLLTVVFALGGAFLIWGWPRMQIRLYETGVDIRYADELTRCPWTLFNAGGSLDGRAPFLLLLPVNGEAIPGVELFRDGVMVAAGRDVRSGAIQFLPGNRAQVYAAFAIDPEHLGRLLLDLGHALGPGPPIADSD